MHLLRATVSPYRVASPANTMGSTAIYKLKSRLHSVLHEQDSQKSLGDCAGFVPSFGNLHEAAL